MSYCLNQLPAYSVNQCGELRVRGIGDVFLLAQGVTFVDPTDPVEWAAKLAANDVVIIKNIKGQYANPEPENASNPRERGPEEILQKLNHTLTLTDANVNASNDNFYEVLNTQTFGGIGWYNPNEVEIRLAYADVRAMAMPASNVDAEFQLYNCSFMWESNPNDFPGLYNAPAGVFA